MSFDLDSLPPELHSKIQWMAVWCVENRCALSLQGTVGFGRDCVGILAETHYPEYEWCDRDTFERIDHNGEVWAPKDAYHKHECVAVLGKGPEAIEQLYEWLQWFHKNDFELRKFVRKRDPSLPVELHYALYGDYNFRMVKRGSIPQGEPQGELL